jgi:hypothetical protein
MKKALLLAVAFLVSIPLGLSAQSDTPSEGYYAPSYARLTYVSGDVFVQRPSDLGTEKAEVNLALVRGDKLGTGVGQVEIHFGRRNYLRLDDNTKVEFALLPVEGDDRIKIHVLEGSAYLRVSALAGDKAIEVHTPDASTYILEEGLYRFNVSVNKQTEFIVLEGSLEAAGEEGSVVVHSRQSLLASDGRLLADPDNYYSRSDAFDQWNQSRDALFAQRSSTRYLPSDLGDYEEELDQNGQWTYEQPYGYVWTPYGIDDDWRPYMYGHWSWYAGLGWNWISSEPWGWSVYHYGRWHWRFGLGWYWIPQNHWGPAWVHWWWDNDYIGWCPLSYYNRPVVLSNNHFYDRYRDNYFPGNNRAMSVIRRDQLQSRDLGRHVLRGGELNRISRVSLRAEQPAGRPGIGRTSLQSPEAQRIFSARPGIRSVAKNYSPGNSVSASRLRDGSRTASDNASRISSSVERRGAVTGRSSVGRTAATDAAPAERGIRVYSRDRGAASTRQGSASQAKSEGISRSPRSAGSSAGDSSARVYPSRRETSGAATRQDSPKGTERQKREESSSGAKVRSGEGIKQYPSSQRETASSWASRSSSTSRAVRADSSPSSRTFPSRLKQDDSRGSQPSAGYSSRSTAQGIGTGRSARTTPAPSRVTRDSGRTSSYSGYAASPGGSASSPRSSVSQAAPRYNPRTYSYSRPSSSSSSNSRSFSSSRPNTSSYSRSSAPRYSAPSQSRGSYSSPSRSGGSSSRSYSAPKSSGSSSSRSSSPSRSSSSSGRSSGARKRG